MRDDVGRFPLCNDAERKKEEEEEKKKKETAFPVQFREAAAAFATAYRRVPRNAAYGMHGVLRSKATRSVTASQTRAQLV